MHKELFLRTRIQNMLSAIHGVWNYITVRVPVPTVRCRSAVTVLECPYPSSLLARAHTSRDLRHGLDQCEQTETDEMSIACTLRPRSTMRISFAGCRIPFRLFNYTTKHTIKQHFDDGRRVCNKRIPNPMNRCTHGLVDLLDGILLSKVA
jgi:hypothetical protein